MYCEYCGALNHRPGGNGHFYCSPGCAATSRRESSKLRHRGYLSLVGTDGKRHAVRVAKRERPDSCEICHKERDLLHWHHWDDVRPELGMWLCSHCHRHVEFYERGLVDVYLALKQQVSI